MKKLNVCLINDSFPPAIDGVANAVTNYARIISDELGRATVVTPYYPDADDSVFNFPVVRYPSVDMTKLVGYRAGLPFSAETMGQLMDEKFDLIHSHCPITSTMLSRALRERLDVPVVFTYHTKFDIDIANAVRGKLLQDEAARMLVENINACDEVWTVSRGAGENLRKLGYKGRYIVMPNGVDFPKGRVSDEEVEAATAEYSLPHDIPTFLFVGRMMWYKGIRIILDALKMLSESGKDFRMVFVGAGTDKDEIVSYSQELGLSDKVVFVPPIHDRNIIRAWYCRADLFLFPSTFDTNGLVVREAAACALPSVLIAGSCAAEDVADGDNGFLIEENAESMFEALKRLMADLPAVKAAGERAQNEIYISWEQAVRRAFERYQVVIDDYKRGLYAPHESFSDDFYKAMAETLAAIAESRKAQQDVIANVKKERSELQQSVIDDAKELYDDLKQSGQKVKDKITGYIDRFL